MKAGDLLPENVNIDERGTLTSVELSKMTGKVFKRFFLISNVKGGERGGHAHIYTDQVLKVIEGNMVLIYENKSEKINKFLNKLSPPIYLPKLTWVEMQDISEDALILVLSSDVYNFKNSLRTYHDYKKFINQY
jgi:hypothetical protein